MSEEPFPHGTTRGYLRHKRGYILHRNFMPPTKACPACKRAWRLYYRGKDKR